MISLIKKKYTLENVKRRRESREYATSIIRVVNTVELSFKNQVMLIYNDINSEFQRNIRYSSKDSADMKEILSKLNRFRDI